MTKEQAIIEATKIANRENMVMAVVIDPIINHQDEEPTGPWGFCPNDARHQAGMRKGDFILYPWAEETILIRPK